METISIKVPVSKDLHNKLRLIQDKLRQQKGRKIALSEILLNFALKGMQNAQNIEQNLGQSEQNDLFTAQNISQTVQNQRQQLLLEDIELLKDQWEERFELLEQMQEELYRRERDLYAKETQLNRQKQELEADLQSNIERDVKLRLYEAEISDLRQERRELLDQIQSLTDNYEALQKLIKELLVSHNDLTRELQLLTKATDTILTNQNQSNGLLDKLLALSPLAVYAVEKWKG